jgi:hypothetical protein
MRTRKVAGLRTEEEMRHWYPTYREANKAWKAVVGTDYYHTKPGEGNGLEMHVLAKKQAPKRKNRYFVGTYMEWLDAY